jgi:hypothetical protein
MIPSICDSRYSFEIFDFYSKAMKFACFVSNPLRYIDANHTCEQNGMELIRFLENSDFGTSYTTTFLTITTKLNNTGFNNVWLNGLKPADAPSTSTTIIPYYSQPGNERITTSIPWVQPVDQTHDCLQYQKVITGPVPGRYGFGSEECAVSAPFYCELIELPPICDPKYSFEIYYSGSYLRTACFVSNALTYAAAQSNCEANGMELLKFANDSQPFEYGEIFDTIYAKLKVSPFNNAWINGQKSGSNYFIQPGFQPIFGVGYYWLSSYLGADQGDCLQLRLVTTEFEASITPKPIGFAGEQCDAVSPSYCEFINVH